MLRSGRQIIRDSIKEEVIDQLREQGADMMMDPPEEPAEKSGEMPFTGVQTIKDVPTGDLRNELNTERIQAFLADTMVNRSRAIEMMLLSDGTCGIREVWDYGRTSNGNRITVTYELDQRVPYGTMETCVKSDD